MRLAARARAAGGRLSGSSVQVVVLERARPEKSGATRFSSPDQAGVAAARPTPGPRTAVVRRWRRCISGRPYTRARAFAARFVARVGARFARILHPLPPLSPLPGAVQVGWPVHARRPRPCRPCRRYAATVRRRRCRSRTSRAFVLVEEGRTSAPPPRRARLIGAGPGESPCIASPRQRTSSCALPPRLSPRRRATTIQASGSRLPRAVTPSSLSNASSAPIAAAAPGALPRVADCRESSAASVGRTRRRRRRFADERDFGTISGARDAADVACSVPPRGRATEAGEERRAVRAHLLRYSIPNCFAYASRIPRSTIAPPHTSTTTGPSAHFSSHALPGRRTRRRSSTRPRTRVRRARGGRRRISGRRARRLRPRRAAAGRVFFHTARVLPRRPAPRAPPRRSSSRRT